MHRPNQKQKKLPLRAPCPQRSCWIGGPRCPAAPSRSFACSKHIIKERHILHIFFEIPLPRYFTATVPIQADGTTCITQLFSIQNNPPVLRGSLLLLIEAPELLLGIEQPREGDDGLQPLLHHGLDALLSRGGVRGLFPVDPKLTTCTYIIIHIGNLVSEKKQKRASLTQPSLR